MEEDDDDDDPQIFYQWHYSSYFEFLLQNLVCLTHCMLLTMRLVVFWLLPMRQSVFMSPQIKMYSLSLYSCVKASCKFFKY